MLRSLLCSAKGRLGILQSTAHPTFHLMLLLDKETKSAAVFTTSKNQRPLQDRQWLLRRNQICLEVIAVEILILLWICSVIVASIPFFNTFRLVISHPHWTWRPDDEMSTWKFIRHNWCWPRLSKWKNRWVVVLLDLKVKATKHDFHLVSEKKNWRIGAGGTRAPN